MGQMLPVRRHPAHVCCTRDGCRSIAVRTFSSLGRLRSWGMAGPQCLVSAPCQACLRVRFQCNSGHPECETGFVQMTRGHGRSGTVFGYRSRNVAVTLAFALSLLMSSAAHAGGRVALVIGNAAYKHAAEL